MFYKTSISNSWRIVKLLTIAIKLPNKYNFIIKFFDT